MNSSGEGGWVGAGLVRLLWHHMAWHGAARMSIVGSSMVDDLSLFTIPHLIYSRRSVAFFGT